MTSFTCSGCGQTWPENYCPACHATIDRSAIATAVASPLGTSRSLADKPSAGSSWTSAPPWPSNPLRSGSAQPETTVPFTFTGTAGEYFRIWIVNVALSVLTLGIYAAWAKVSQRRYLWGSTQLGGRPFEYTGNPIAILKGYLIVGAGSVLYIVATRVQPLVALVVLVLIWAIYPWLFQQSLRFNAHNTRHRNIRFGFHGSAGESYAINLGWPLLVPLTAGLLWPWIHFRRKRYQLGNLSYGTVPFRFDGTVQPFYGYFGKSLLMLLGAGILIFIVFTLIVAGARPLEPDHASLLGFGLFGALYLAGLAIFGTYYATQITNVVLGHTSLPGVATLRCWMLPGEVFTLELTNLLAILATLGLAIPWATVRRHRYRWSRLEARFVGSLDQVSAAVADEPGALADVAAHQLDIDISL